MIIANPARLGATAILLCSISGLALAQGTAEDPATLLPPIYIAGSAIKGPQSTASGTVFDPATLGTPSYLDGGAVLTTLPGIASSRMGGHGLDIVIRGLNSNQINVIDAGAVTYGGCPNHMDPPASTAAFARADRVTVTRGYASVTNGPGGTGGTVRLEREAPPASAASGFTGEAHASAGSNANALGAGGRFTWTLGNGFYVKGAVEAKDADDYADGAGRTVRSAYEQTSGGLTFGYAGQGFDIALDHDRDAARDVLFAGAGMDSPSTDTSVWRLRGGVDLDAGALRRIEAEVFLSEVDHVMDNYSLRPATGMFMRVPTTSDTRGGKVEAQLAFGSTTARVGIDHQSNNRMAILYGGMAAARPAIEAANPANARFLMWPDVTIEQTGLYAETETELDAANTLKLGLRYDHVKASAGAAAGLPGYAAAAPNGFYTTYYGTTFNDARREDNWGGLIRFEHDFGDGLTGFVGLSRSVRTADATERAMGRNNWVGNPDIAPEKHLQFDLGVEVKRDDWGLTATAYVDRVDDFILRDASTYAGVTTYRNVSAQLAGVELSGSWQSGGLQLTGDLTYTRGQNRDDDAPLAQIPPLMGKLAVSYGQGAWRLGTQMVWADGQDRIDPARDPAATPGYAVFNLFGSYDISETVTLTAGVDNLFDRAYATHLARSNAVDPALVQVYEPGRTFHLALSAKF
ncbi:TonB-dependent receptor domain-containing protein [Fuscovulum blasticum]|uniref:TonB-dependent receptor domain-containing protein n=1 Tax=Fuscovulum blasticum TaxID=1075 RepID=UPI000D3E6364|nr:TonB-dependent receptor [Fuscovulum blasticum]AWD22581.1 hypothetical protein B6K69_13600 [Fuscovulum blasticum]